MLSLQLAKSTLTRRLNKMRSFILCAATVALVTTAFPLMANAQSRDEKVCYRIDDDDYKDDRVVLNVKFHSDLTFRGGFRQSVYDALGKHVDTDEDGGRPETHMAVAHGAVVVTDRRGGSGRFQSGAHLGLEAIWVRNNKSSIDFDCTTEEEDPTPDTWSCMIRAENDRRSDEVDLVKVDDRRDRFCGFFEDGEGDSRR
jgi:hypothetical protein